MHAELLNDLMRELFDSAPTEALLLLCGAEPLEYQDLLRFDQAIGGPSFDRLNFGGRGNYEVADRDVFRPLQYCGAYIELLCDGQDISWLTRELVHMSGLHLEGLVKRIGRVGRLPLGAALGNALVKHRIDPATWDQLRRFSSVYNDAKHTVDHPKDTHLFSSQDGMMSYFISRELGSRLYPLAHLVTDWMRFDTMRHRPSPPEPEGTLAPKWAGVEKW